MKRHQEILEIIVAIVVLCLMIFFAYRFISELPHLFVTIAGIVTAWLAYNLRINIARIFALFNNTKVPFWILKNSLDSGRAIPLKKYIFSKAIYHFYYYNSRDELEKVGLSLEEAEKYLTESLKSLKERDEKVKQLWRKEKYEALREEFEKESGYSLEDEPVFEKRFIKFAAKRCFKLILLTFSNLYKNFRLVFKYSSLKEPAIYYYRGATRAATKKYEMANEDFEISKNSSLYEKESLYGILYVYYHWKKYDDGLKVLNDILDIDEKHAKAIYIGGKIHFNLGNRDMAFESWSKAIKYGYKESEKEKNFREKNRHRQ